MNKQAIIIIAHNSIDILNKLLELIDSKYFDIFIHIDKKSDINYEDLYKCKYSILNCYKEYDIKWGNYSLTEAELLLFDEASKNNYEYYHLISGVDLPLKSNKYIYELFHNSYPKEFIHFENPQSVEYKKDWIKYYHLKDFNDEDNKFVEKQKKDGVDRLINDPTVLRCGSNWVSITHEFVMYLLSKKEYIEDRFSYTKISDEFYFQTLIYNSKYIDNLYYKEFDDNYEASLRCIDWNRGLPYVWKEEDYEYLINSNKVFARKFDSNKDNNIINKIYDYVKELNKLDN